MMNQIHHLPVATATKFEAGFVRLKTFHLFAVVAAFDFETDSAPSWRTIHLFEAVEFVE